MYRTWFSFLLIVSTLCNQTVYQNQTTYDTIKSYYYAQQFQKIYELTTPNWSSEDEDGNFKEYEPDQAEKDANLKKFVDSLASRYKYSGPMIYDVDHISQEAVTFDDISYTFHEQTVAFQDLYIDQIQVITDGGNISYINFDTIAEDYNLQDEGYYTTSLSIIFNGVESLNLNQNQKVLGSLNYIPIALEFARQVDALMIDPTLMIDRDQLLKFIIPDHDYVQIDKKSMSLQDVAISMYYYQSPGLAEYLQTRLGLSNIDNMTTKMGIKASNSYYESSFALAFTNYKSLSIKHYKTSIAGMTSKALYRSQLMIHKILMAGGKEARTILKNAENYFQTKLVTDAMDKRSKKYTTQQYASLYNNINNSSMLSTTIANLFYNITNPGLGNHLVKESNGYTNSVGFNQLQVAVDGVSSIAYAVSVKGSLEGYQPFFKSLNDLIQSGPVFCRDFYSRFSSAAK